MKAILWALLGGGVLFAQTSPLSPATPPAAPPSAPAQVPASQKVPPETIVAEVAGKKYTAAEVSKMFNDLPPQMMLAVQNDPKRVFSGILLLQHLAAEAEKAKLDQQSPTKEALEYQRLNLLATAEINQVKNIQFNPTPDETEKMYNANLARYREAKIRVIYVAFSSHAPVKEDSAAKKVLTEAEAKSKVEELRKKLLAGADFSDLAKQNSDDKESAPKGGEFPPMKKTSPYPDTIKTAVYALKPGQVSEPLRLTNGYYLIRLDEFKQQPYEEVRVDIYEEMKQKDFNEWMQTLQKRFEVKVENPTYFTPAPAPVSPAH